jgi:hypothetical protein
MLATQNTGHGETVLEDLLGDDNGIELGKDAVL